MPRTSSFNCFFFAIAHPTVYFSVLIIDYANSKRISVTAPMRRVAPQPEPAIGLGVLWHQLPADELLYEPHQRKRQNAHQLWT
jgi:hypothetical protein